MSERALVVIPTYNEAATLPQLVPQVLAQDDRIEILIVDDNSPDGTGIMADQTSRTNSRVHAMHREGKLGLGTAYIAGFKWALERGYEYAFQIEMSVRAWRKGFKLREIPIVFVDRTEGQSKMNKAIVREAVWKVPRLRLMEWFGRI